MDDGFALDHPDLAPFLWRNPDEIAGNDRDDDSNGYVDDVNGWDVADDDADVVPHADVLEQYYHGTYVSSVLLNALEQNANTLSRDERLYCMNTFVAADKVFQALTALPGPYILNALSGFGSAINHMFSQPPHYGQTKWSTPQAAEKVLKNHLVSRGLDVPRRHDLKTLAKIVSDGPAP